MTSGPGAATAERPWRSLFPFEPYPQQRAAIDRLLSVLADDGWLAMEGACGTGKTLVALVAGLHAVRADSFHAPENADPVALPSYERVVAVTPVKQQLAQFVAETRAINARGDGSAASGLVLRGLADMLAYTQADDLDFPAAWGRIEGRRAGRLDDSGGSDSPPPFGERVDRLREATADVVAVGSPVDLRWSGPAPSTCSVEDCARLAEPGTVGRRCPVHREHGDGADGPWYDAVRARRVAAIAETAAVDGDRLSVHDTETPFPARMVRIADVADPAQELLGLDWDDPVDPFYARSLADPVPVSFTDGHHRVLDRDDLVPAAAADGHCPHRVMGGLLSDAEVVLGNYTHLFDPETRRLTEERGGVLDEGTVAVVDEAHVVEDRVREMRSDRVSIYSLARAVTDVERAARLLRGGGLGSATGEAAERAEREAGKIAHDAGLAGPGKPLSPADFDDAAATLDWLLRWIGDRIDGERRRGKLDPRAVESELSIPLSPPESADTDALTAAFEAGEAPVDGTGGADRVAAACRAAAEIHRTVAVSERSPVADAVGTLLSRWVHADPVTHFRELVAEPADNPAPPESLPAWAEQLTVSLSVYTCIPTDAIAAVYADLGGGVAMSATLEPLDVYAETAGLAALEDGVPDDPLAPPGEGRRVDRARYPLAFPDENRETWAVDVDRFTHRNRGEPTTDHAAMTDTRAAHAHVIEQVAAAHGNVLLCLPNYREAAWAADLLETGGTDGTAVDKPVYLDQSSPSTETTRLLEAFFDDDHAVLVTSALGTVTEGVDYPGDRLHTACVVGVPYRNTNTPRMRAVRTAYDERVGGDRSGFETAVAVPAVRKARQAIGRVIRGPDERGVRILADERYCLEGRYGVRAYLSEQERAELRTVGSDMVKAGLAAFWDDRDGG